MIYCVAILLCLMHIMCNFEFWTNIESNFIRSSDYSSDYSRLRNSFQDIISEIISNAEFWILCLIFAKEGKDEQIIENLCRKKPRNKEQKYCWVLFYANNTIWKKDIQETKNRQQTTSSKQKKEESDRAEAKTILNPLIHFILHTAHSFFVFFSYTRRLNTAAAKCMVKEASEEGIRKIIIGSIQNTVLLLFVASFHFLLWWNLLLILHTIYTHCDSLSSSSSSLFAFEARMEIQL